MKKSVAKNLRAKRKYLLWLADAKGLSPQSIDKAAAAIDHYQAFNSDGDFAAFHPEKARAFKRHLDKMTNERTGEPLAPSTLGSILRDVKAFFQWLADQPGYKSKIAHSEVAYFSAARSQARSAYDNRLPETDSYASINPRSWRL
ncbi:MAG: hypothetical protein MRY63_00765 [Neomegalonema sp.]|nr:hypothetical protein [Neomegalonema sp.]